MGTDKKPLMLEQTRYTFSGRLSDELCQEFENDYRCCPHCGTPTYRHTADRVKLKHITYGNGYVVLDVKVEQRRCPHCKKVFRQDIPFKHPEHMITLKAANLIIAGMLLNPVIKRTALQLGISRNIVKEIHKQYLKETLLDENNRPNLKGYVCRSLGVDEWKLFAGNQMASIILDADNGRILWVEETKKQQVIYDFVNHVGPEFMMNVQCIVSDMNADFGDAFRKRYPHIDIVYDRFHLVNNLNEMVLRPVRIAVEKQLRAEGRKAEATRLKRNKYVLTANPETLKKKDEEGRKLIAQGKMAGGPTTTIFDSPKEYYIPRTDYEETYKSLLEDNAPLALAEIIKEQLRAAYNAESVEGMKDIMTNLIRLCEGYALPYAKEGFARFGQLVKGHLEGIINFAKYRLTSGICEGVVRLIKTIRWQAYGFTDTDYFFLRLFDATNPDRTCI